MRFSSRAALSTGLVCVGLVGGIMFGVANWYAADAAAQQAKPEKPEQPMSPDEADVHKTLEAFVNAFNENEAKKMAAALSPTAEFIDDDGNRVEGSAAVVAFLGKFLDANKGAKLHITREGARTVAPGVVTEDGASVITVPEKNSQSERKFSAVYAKVDGAWKIASIREYPEEPEVLSAEERLKDLAWFVGEWVDEGGDSLVTNSVRLSADKTHVIRDFSVQRAGDEVMKGMQWIGVDPLTGNIKGWSFDTSGGRSDSTWTKNGAEWLIRSTGVTSDGDESGATYLIKPLGKDRIEVKVVHKVVGNTVEADSTAVMVRKPTAPKK